MSSFFLEQSHCLILFCLCLSLFSDMNDTYSEGNTDTVGQIVHYIMSNEGRRKLMNECTLNLLCYSQQSGTGKV